MDDPAAGGLSFGEVVGAIILVGRGSGGSSPR